MGQKGRVGRQTWGNIAYFGKNLAEFCWKFCKLDKSSYICKPKTTELV